MGFGSGYHWIILLVIVLILFGNRLPSVMRSLGRGVTEFKKGIEGGDDDDAPKVEKKAEGEAKKAEGEVK
jgi:sec-independent protein translocase protein TatA